MIDKIYGVLVNKVPGIQEKYNKKRRKARNSIERCFVWVYLLHLNILYHVFRKREIGALEKYPVYEEIQLYSQASESSISRKSPKELVGELRKYDVISFDVFDTLILRPFSEATDLFFVIGEKLNYPDFQRIRIEMEWKAREKKYKKEKNYEVTLEEIYTLLSRETGIDKDRAMDLELEMEFSFCYANPFMSKVVELLKQDKKKIIITSDMYLSENQIRNLLEKTGYQGISAYYVSSDVGKSKNKGDLFDFVIEEEIKRCGKKEIKFAHVGDNYISDIKQSEKHGFKPFHYVNVNAVGKPYRSYDMSVITGSLYRGIVNDHIHNGIMCYSREYEYGYIYGGLFVTGFCQFIHKYAKEHQVDKILFLARDGDILLKAYQIMYEREAVPYEYVYWSRLAAVKMSASYYKYDYFRRFLYHKVNQNYSIEEILKAMELTDMIEDLCQQTELRSRDILTDRNVEKVKSFLMNSWKKVLEHYEEQLIAGKQYYGSVLSGCKKAVAVDIGWAGSGAISLNYIVNELWNLNCDIVGIIAGTNTCHNSEPDTSETYLQTGKLVSYMYSQRENRDLWKFHNPGKDHNLYWELLLDAPMGSFLGFYLNEQNQFECRFKEVKTDIAKIKEIQRGILDFVKEYMNIQNKIGEMAMISGRDAYAPMLNIERSINKDFMRTIEKLMDEVNVG